MSTGEIITVIAAVGAALVSLTNAVAAGWGRRRAEVRHQTVDRKLDEIHTLTNSNLTLVQNKLKDALVRIDRLEVLLEAALKRQHEDPV